MVSSHRRTVDPVIQQCHPQYKRTYTRIKNISPDIRNFVADEVSKGTRRKKILAALESSGETWKDHELKHRLKSLKLSNRNLKLKQRSYIRRQVALARAEGRRTPEFEHTEDGFPVRKTQVEAALKNREENYQGPDADVPGIRVVAVEDDIDIDMPVSSPADDGNESPIIRETSPMEIEPPLENMKAPFWTSPIEVRTCIMRTINYISNDPQQEPSKATTQTPVLEPQSEQFAESTGNSSEATNQETPDTSGLPFNNFENACDWIKTKLKQDPSTHSTNTDSDPHPTDKPEIWSKIYCSNLEHWIELTRILAIEAFKRTLALREGPDDDILACYDRIGTSWVPEYYFRFLHWQTTSLPPLHILKTFFEDQDSLSPEIRDAFFRKDLTEFNPPTPAEAKQESRILRKLYNDNFYSIARTALTQSKYRVWNSEFRSQVVHLLTIEERFCTGHYFLVQAIFRIVEIMENAEMGDINNRDIIRFLLVLLVKLFRLNLGKSMTGDIPRALLHLFRALVRIGSITEAAQVYEQFLASCIRTGNYRQNLYRGEMSLLTGLALMREGKKEEGSEYLLQGFKAFKRFSPLINASLDKLGHDNAIFDFLTIGKSLRMAGCVNEAASSFDNVIERCGEFKYRMLPRMYEAVHEQGKTHATLRQYELALTFLEDDLKYRADMNIRHTAGPSLKAMAYIFETTGINFRPIQPSTYIKDYIEYCEKKGEIDDQYVEFKYIDREEASVNFIEDAEWASGFDSRV